MRGNVVNVKLESGPDRRRDGLHVRRSRRGGAENCKLSERDIPNKETLQRDIAVAFAGGGASCGP
jgi:hypothetical protein